ncbi:hypothetical protein CISIN_1g0391591mg, partial [Citrus sinensis]
MMGIHNTMEGVPSSMIREVSCLMELNHPNIIRLMRVASQGIYLYPVFEYQVNDLAYLLKYPKDSMNGYSTKNFNSYSLFTTFLLVEEFSSSDSSRSLSFGTRYIRRDLKPVNILVDLDGKTVKVAGFGLAKSLYAYKGESSAE